MGSGRRLRAFVIPLIKTRHEMAEKRREYYGCNRNEKDAMDRFGGRDCRTVRAPVLRHRVGRAARRTCGREVYPGGVFFAAAVRTAAGGGAAFDGCTAQGHHAAGVGSRPGRLHDDLG